MRFVIVVMILLVPAGARASDKPSIHFHDTQAEVLRVGREALVPQERVVVVSLTTDTPIEILRRLDEGRGGLARPTAEANVIIAPALWGAFQRLNIRPQRIRSIAAVAGVLLMSEERMRRLMPNPSDESWQTWIGS